MARSWRAAPFHCSRRTCQSLVHPALDTVALCHTALQWYNVQLYIFTTFVLQFAKRRKQSCLGYRCTLPQWHNVHLPQDRIAICKAWLTVMPWIPLQCNGHLVVETFNFAMCYTQSCLENKCKSLLSCTNIWYKRCSNVKAVAIKTSQKCETALTSQCQLNFWSLSFVFFVFLAFCLFVFFLSFCLLVF